MAEFRLETERLILRTWREEDRTPFAMMNADPMVMKHFVSAQSSEQTDALVRHIERHFAEFGFGLFALERREDGLFIGFTGFNSAPENTPVAGEVEIGWRLAREFWRKGYAYEAASACLDWFWRATGHSRVVSFTATSNLPSQNLMQKLGLTRRQALDFDHPAVPEGHPLRHQTVFAIDREGMAHG